MKCLLVAPAWVGDMVMAHPLVALLHTRDPDCEVHILAPAATLPLAARMPGIHGSMLLEVGHGELGLGKRWAVARGLRGFDRAIVLPNSFKSALVPWFARIPVRTGWTGEQRLVLLNDRRTLDEIRYPLMIERFMALGLPAGEPLPTPYPRPVLRVDEANRAALVANLGLARLDRVVALCPGAEFGPAKRWPEDKYAEVARALVDRGHAVWLFGSPGDAAVCAAIASAAPGVTDLAGRTRLVDAVDLLSLCDAAVVNDSGLMHVACALGVRVVAIYGSTSPSFTPPLGERVAIVREPIECSPCFQRVCPLGHMKCLNDLPVRAVLEALA
jgi:heptosyltransferase-2